MMLCLSSMYSNSMSPSKMRKREMLNGRVRVRWVWVVGVAGGSEWLVWRVAVSG